MVTERGLTEYQRDVVLALRRRIVELGQGRYDAMLLGVYELLALKQEEFEARRELVEHLRNYWIAHTELELAVGRRFEPGMGGMHEMGRPKNTLPMMAGEGPFGAVEMGGMFTVLTIRDRLPHGYDVDPGWYEYPRGTKTWKVEPQADKKDTKGTP